MSRISQLETWDYLSLTICVVLSSCIGMYYAYTARRSTVWREFLVVNRQLGILPLIASAAATSISAVSMLGFPMEAYVNGTTFLLINITTLLIIPIGTHLFIPVYFQLDRNSIFEYLDLRFSRKVRTCVSLIYSVQVVFTTACVIYAPALALNLVTGLHVWLSVGIVGGVGTVYAAMGGFKAVVWADTCQFILMITITLLILIKGTIDIGGLTVIWDRLNAGNRADVFIWSSSPNSQYTVWTFFIANIFYKVIVFATNQSMMQRYLSNPDLKKAQLSFVGGSITIFLFSSFQVLMGLLIYASYHDCDPLLNGQINKRDQLMPLFAVQTLTFMKGLPGIFIAGLLCASISTLTSHLNSLAIIALSDFIIPTRPNLSHEVLMRLSKGLVVLFGSICIALVTIIERTTGIIQVVFSFYGLISGPILSLFLSGMLLPWVNSKGAVVGLVVSMVLPWWSWLGRMVTSPAMPHAPYSIEGCSNYTSTANRTLVIHSHITQKGFFEEFYSINTLWYTSWCVVVGLFVALLVSKLTGFEDLSQANPDLFFPFVKRYIVQRQLKLANLMEGPRAMDQKKVVHPLLYQEDSKM